MSSNERSSPPASAGPVNAGRAEGTPVTLAPRSPVPYATYAIVGITVAIYLLQLGSTYVFGYASRAAGLDWLEAYGARINDLILAGQVWRFITPVLLHASVPHILFNMYALVAFGAGLERSLGHWRFLILYLMGAFAGNVLSFLLSSGYSVGASTAVFGLIGAEGIVLLRNRKLFRGHFGSAIGNIIFIIVVNLMLGLTPGIDNFGHIGGLLGGAIFAWFAGPIWEPAGQPPAMYLQDTRDTRDIITGAAVVVLIFGALAVWGMFQPLAR